MFVRAIASLAVLTIAACGGGGSVPSTGASPAELPAAQPAAASAPSQPSALTFLDVLGQAKGASYKVVYKFSATGSESISGEQIWYVKPPKMRIEYSIGGMRAGSTSFILEDGIYHCGVRGGESRCVGVGQGALKNQPADFEAEVRKETDKFTTTPEGTRTIAGQTGHCFGVKDSRAIDKGESHVCYTTQGILLSMVSKTPEGSVSMEATSIGSVSDADFKLPVAPTTY